MADVKFETVRTTIPTSGPNFDVTIAGFGDPQAILFFATSASADDTLTNDFKFAVGMIDRQSTPGNVTICSQSRTGIGASDTHRTNNTGAVLRDVDTGLSDTYLLQFDSWVTDGIRLTIADAPATALLLTAVFIGGDDVTNTYAGSLDLGSTAKTTDINAVGFEPDLVFTIGVCHSSTGTANGNYFTMGCAHNDGADTQGSLNLWDKNGVGTANCGGQLRNNRIGTETFDGAESYNITIGSFDSNGFSLTTDASAGGDELHYLALKFSGEPDISLDFLDGPTATGDYTTEAPGFKPTFLMLFMSDNLSANTVESLDGMSILVADSTGTYHNAALSENGAGTMNCKSISSDSIHDITGAAADLHVGTFDSFSTNGFTLNFSTVPASARKWMALTVGPSTWTTKREDTTSWTIQ